MPLKPKYANNLTIYEFPRTCAVLMRMKDTLIKSLLVEAWLLVSGYIKYRQDIEKTTGGDYVMNGCGSLIRRGTKGCPLKHIAFLSWFKTHHRWERPQYTCKYQEDLRVLNAQIWCPNEVNPELFGIVLGVADYEPYTLIQPFNEKTAKKAYEAGGFNMFAVDW